MRTVELADVATEIDASPEQVWAVLTDFPRYPEWSAYIEKIDGSAEVGTTLGLVMSLPGQRPIVTRLPLIEATPGVRLAWAAIIPGAKWLPKSIFGGVHEFVLTALPDGGTKVVQREHLTGVLAQQAKKKVPGVDEGFAAFNAALKARAEKLA